MRCPPTGCATLLLNAGARLETIQPLLGHEYLRTTQVYARVHDATVASDYYRAMAAVEQRVTLETETHAPDSAFWPRLLALLDKVLEANDDPPRQEAAMIEIRRWIAVEAEISPTIQPQLAF